MSQAPLLTSEHFSPSVSLHSGRPATTSLEVAKFFNKRHDAVLRDIRRIYVETPDNFRAHNFVETFRTVPGPNNSERQEIYFILYRDGFMLLVMGYTGKKALAMKLAYIEAFNRMEEELARQKEAARNITQDIVGFPGATSPISKRTDPERKQLTAIINTWVGMAPIHYASARAQVNAHFGVTGVDKLTVEQVKEAIRWVQAKIDALPPQGAQIRKQAALPTKDKYTEFLDWLESVHEGRKREYEELVNRVVMLFDPLSVGVDIFRLAVTTCVDWAEKELAGKGGIHRDDWRGAPFQLVKTLEQRGSTRR